MRAGKGRMNRCERVVWERRGKWNGGEEVGGEVRKRGGELKGSKEWDQRLVWVRIYRWNGLWKG